MVPPASHGIPRAPWYSGTVSRKPARFRLQGYHLLWRIFPDPSANDWVYDFPRLLQQPPKPPHNPRVATLAGLAQPEFGLFPFRSPLLWESRLISFPWGTKMFQFPQLAHHLLCVQRCVSRHDPRRVSPFGNPRIYGCLHLPEAYRSLPRPSSPSCAKASTVRP